MKRRDWVIPSVVTVLAGLGYAVADGVVATPEQDVPDAAEKAEFVPPRPSDRVSLGYRKKDVDADFEEVRVSTVEPFADLPAIDRQIVASVAVEQDAMPASAAGFAPADDFPQTSSKENASALLKRVAEAGNKAASEMGAAERPFETTPLATRLLDAEKPAWQSRFYADNPLVGGIFHGDGRQTDAASLIGAAKAARYVLLGETHDNPDHHRLQADIVDDLAADASVTMSLVFEMIPQNLGEAVAGFGTGRANSVDLDGLGQRLEWAERGWPDYSMYRPLFETAKREGIAVRPGNLDAEAVRAIVRDGLESLSRAERERLSLDRPADPAILDAMAETVRQAHCGLMPDVAIAPMVGAQRARDGALAAAMLEAAETTDKAVLIAGSGHVRNDRAVPSILNETDPQSGSISVQMLEVAENEEQPSDYGLRSEAPAPFDFTIFTPRGDLTDHCAELRERMAEQNPTD
ncbi:ChaN family lipoprotein [Jiella marina]|uniref:ChaN family lipoprotein n=1 Tax=Jiella sp. LLJ827 TaxID=2917712 RepID=UPI0021009A94|nr:ChaN family lipoprotein [Jiella sp. LLJ827]MCQ0987592.1 ChaN family lipoprotein [Jiella sp. LLJ827]